MSQRWSIYRKLAVAASVAALVGLQALPARADLIAYDGFLVDGSAAAYLVGNDSTGVNVLGGQAPVIGPEPFYTGGWIQSGGDAQAVFDIGSLAYPLFPNAGGQVTDSVQFSCCSFGRNGREINGGLGDEGTIYQSFLVDFGTQGTDDPTQFGKRGYEMWNGGVGDSFLALDLFVNHFAGVTNLTFALTTAGSGTQSELVNGGGLTLEALAGVHLVVLRFDFSDAAADRVRLYLDPVDSNEGNYVPAADISVVTSDLAFTHHGTLANFTFSGAGHDPGAFDEVRWGDTFADVTPFGEREVPEPATMALLAAGLAGVAYRRRAKRL